MLFEELESISTVEDSLTYGEMLFPVKGWNHPKEFEQYVKDWFKTEGEYDIEIVDKKESAFYTTRYFDGQDARVEGYNHWIEFVGTWKKGYGKCTIYTVKKKED
jgi:hypothetical protein